MFTSKRKIKKPEPQGFDADFAFNQKQCNSFKIDDSFIDLPARSWSNIDMLVEAAIKCHYTLFKSSEALESILSSLNQISLKKNNQITLKSYCIDTMKFLS